MNTMMKERTLWKLRQCTVQTLLSKRMVSMEIVLFLLIGFAFNRNPERNSSLKK